LTSGFYQVLNKRLPGKTRAWRKKQRIEADMVFLEECLEKQPYI